jgi:hypothetical protein
MAVSRCLICLFIFVFSYSGKQSNTQEEIVMKYNEKDILDKLDSVSSVQLFPSFDISYFYPANCRINLFADKTRWAIVFEVLNYNTMAYNITIDNYYFSNCFIKTEKNNVTNINSIVLSQVDSENLIDDNWLVNPSAKFITIRNQKLPIEFNAQKYKQKQIKGLYFEDVKEQIDIVSLTRYIAEEHLSSVKATNLELKNNLPKDLPFIGSIENWHHMNYIESSNKGHYIGKKPSEYETFQLIAICLVNQNLDFYKPTLQSNSNWRNWPRAGQL